MKNKNRKNIKRKNKSQKGFSMVEILAVVVILGVLSTIGIVSVSRMIENSRKHYYASQVDQMVLAAQSYANDNKNILPKTIGGTNTVYLQELIDNKYIEEIVDQNKNKCYTEDQYDNGKKVKGSRVDIYKSSKSEYKYVGHLECMACQEENTTDNDYSCSTKEKEDKPIIKIGMKKYDAVSDGNSIFNDSNKITITMDAVKKDPNGYNETIKIASYSYKIYVNGTVKYNSGLKINNKKDQIIIEDQLNKYIPGKVTVKVTVTNTLGQTVTKSRSEDYRDAQLPACSNVTYEGKYAMENYDAAQVLDLKTLVCGTPDKYEWLGLNHDPDSRQAWVLCNDKLGVGCAQHEYSINMVNEGHTQSLKMIDKEGNPRTCTIKKCIDKTTPKIVVKVKNGSDVKYTYTEDASTTNGHYKTKDKNKYWLNKENYPNGVTVEVTVSDPPYNKDASVQLSNLKYFKWMQNPKDRKENQEGEATLIKDEQTWDWNENQKSYKKSINITEDGVRKIVLTAIDHAGNEREFTLILKIDRTPPQQPVISMYEETKPSGKSTSTKYKDKDWYNYYVWTTTNKPKDVPDVSGWRINRYKITGDEGKVSDQEGNSRSITTEGTSKITYQSCDNADNCSAYVDPANTVRLDHTKPTCNVSEEGGTKGDHGWYKGGTVKAYTNCKDQTHLSGCDPKFTRLLIHSINSNTAGTTNSKTIKDIAGNERKCSNTIKYDKSKPSCSISNKDWNEGSVLVSVSCSDAGPSGVESCTKSYNTSRTGTHTCNIKDKAGNTSSSSKTVSSKRQKNSCSTCSRCEDAGCDVIAKCTKDCCGQEKKWSNSTNCGDSKCCPSGYSSSVGQSCNWNAGDNNQGGTNGGSSARYYSCSCAKWVNKQCQKLSCCGCDTYNSHCKTCGCKTWGGWKDASSCSESATKTTKTKCRTMYKVG